MQHSRVDSHAQRADRSYVRDSQKRRRYETRTVRSISLRILRDIETIAPSVRSNTQQAKLDRNFLRSGFGTRKTFSSSKPFFLTSGDCRQAWVEALRDERIVKLIKVDTTGNLADLNSKLLNVVRFEYLVNKIMVCKELPTPKAAASMNP